MTNFDFQENFSPASRKAAIIPINTPPRWRFFIFLIVTETKGFQSVCEHENQMCKWNPICTESHGAVRLSEFLVTGAGGSGTAWMRESLRSKGLRVADERWHSNVKDDNKIFDGAVSWPARCWASSAQQKLLSESDHGHGHALFPLGSQWRFATVVQLVRHPLRAIASKLFFASNIRRCCPLNLRMESTAIQKPERTYCEWDWWRRQIWEYVHVFTTEAIPKQPPELWPEEEADDPLTLASRYWLQWNALVSTRELEVPFPRKYNTIMTLLRVSLLLGVCRLKRLLMFACDWRTGQLRAWSCRR